MSEQGGEYIGGSVQAIPGPLRGYASGGIVTAPGLAQTGPDLNCLGLVEQLLSALGDGHAAANRIEGVPPLELKPAQLQETEPLGLTSLLRTAVQRAQELTGRLERIQAQIGRL